MKIRNAPVVSGCKIAGKNTLLVSFNEEVSDASLSASNFLIEQENNRAVKIARKNSCSFLLEFEKEFIDKTMNRMIINKFMR